MTHDAVVVFSKTWGAIYLLVVFIAAIVWTYWPSRRRIYKDASESVLRNEDDRPCR